MKIGWNCFELTEAQVNDINMVLNKYNAKFNVWDTTKQGFYEDKDYKLKASEEAAEANRYRIFTYEKSFRITPEAIEDGSFDDMLKQMIRASCKDLVDNFRDEKGPLVMRKGLELRLSRDIATYDICGVVRTRLRYLPTEVKAQ